jgi:hypothetical protein
MVTSRSHRKFTWNDRHVYFVIVAFHLLLRTNSYVRSDSTSTICLSIYVYVARVLSVVRPDVMILCCSICMRAHSVFCFNVSMRAVLLSTTTYRGFLTRLLIETLAGDVWFYRCVRYVLTDPDLRIFTICEYSQICLKLELEPLSEMFYSLNGRKKEYEKVTKRTRWVEYLETNKLKSIHRKWRETQ